MFQVRIWLEDDLAQLLTVLEQTLAEHPHATGNDHLLYAAVCEPLFPRDLETIWKPNHLRVLLVQTELLVRHFYLRRKIQRRHARCPEAQPAEFLDPLVQLEIRKRMAVAKGNGTDLPQ